MTPGWVWLLVAMLWAPADPGPDDPLHDAEAAIWAWDVGEARERLDRSPASPRAELLAGLLAVYEARYEDAERLLAALLATGEIEVGTPGHADAVRYLALAQGARRALGEATGSASPDGRTQAVFADPDDALLAPYLFDAIASAQEALGPILGVDPPGPVRFEFLDDPAKLAMVTPLTIENIHTTGTVGVTKYRRVMMVTPRVMLYGYGWLDTAVHEYVHYLVTLRTRNRAPVWLQEGLAKLFETRWRRTSPPPLDPGVAYRLHRAIVHDDLVTFEEMYPSVAMLPSAERSALAYAEVETMIGLVFERRGAAGIALLLDAVADGRDPKTALSRAWGDDFDAFFATWTRTLRARTAGSADADLDTLVFREGDDAPPEDRIEDIFSHLGGGRARQHARLGTLLQRRHHPTAAAEQYEKARSADPRAHRDARLSERLGRLYVDLGSYDRAAPLLDAAAAEDPENANLAAAQGLAKLRSGDLEGAHEAWTRAVRVNPFIPSIHCGFAELAVADPERQRFERQTCERLDPSAATGPATETTTPPDER